MNGNGELLIEFAGMVPGEEYFIGIEADRPSLYGTGNYDLNVAFSQLPRQIFELGSGTLSHQNRLETHNLVRCQNAAVSFCIGCP